MPTPERIHVGGVPAKSEPLTIDCGKANFYRKVSKTEEENQTEDQNKDEANTQGSTEIQGKLIEGYLYKWASNVCHLEDTEVEVEDLSDRDIDSGLAQEIAKILSKTLKCDGTETIAYFSPEGGIEGVLTEEFTIPSSLGNWRVCRKTYDYIDVRNKPNSQYSGSEIARKISKAAEANVGPAPSDEEVYHIACRIMAEKKDELPKTNKWQILLNQAHSELFVKRDDDAFKSRLKAELNGDAETPENQTGELVELVTKNLPKRKNNFHQYLLDEAATKECERVEGFDIVILRDEKHELICGVITAAVQNLFPAETLDKMRTAAEAFAWRCPYAKPDDLRHPTSQVVHLKGHPDKDVRSQECQEPHYAVCGVEHYGLHPEAGHMNGPEGLCFQNFSSVKFGNLTESSAWKREFPKLRGGVYGVAEKVSRLSLKAWDPELHEEYLTVQERLPESHRMRLAKTGDNPYGYMAQLVDPLTEGHTDSTDWHKGMAALTCFGEFTGKYQGFFARGDLVLKELGIRIAFPSGTNCHLRGEGLHHLISSYGGIRHSLVLTNKEAVRKSCITIARRRKEEIERAEKLHLKNANDWSDDDHKLYKAYKEGRNAMLEYVWEPFKKMREAKNAKRGPKRKADRSDGDETEKPAPKKAKKETR